MSAHRLVLGTAQLGMAYGVANSGGRPDAGMAREIVATAWAGGIRHFDTAQCYGDSESVLGGCLAAIGASDTARVTTKLSAELDHGNPSRLAAAARQSLTRLGLPRLFALLLHDEAHLCAWEKGFAPALAQLQEAGNVEAGGVSLYSPDCLDTALAARDCRVVQVPANVFDRRFAAHGLREKAGRRGVHVFLRSVFLQGLLLLAPDRLPPGLSAARKPLERFGVLCRDLGLSPRAAALGYLRERHPDFMVLFGADTPAQVEENLADFARPLPPDALAAMEAAFAAPLPEGIVNPSLWPAKDCP